MLASIVKLCLAASLAFVLTVSAPYASGEGRGEDP